MLTTFELHRIEDETGVSGTGIVAEGVEFTDGSVALRWRTATASTVFYASWHDMEAVHIAPHGGKTRAVMTGRPFALAYADAHQDYCENAPFASVGGLDSRDDLKAPDYISPAEREEYLRGYAAASAKLFGEDWRTAQFRWRPALSMGDAEATA